MPDDDRIYRASSFGRRILCPGSAKAECGLPEISSPDAESGTRVHRAALLGDETGCTEEELRLARKWREEHPAPEITETTSVYVEHPLRSGAIHGTLDRIILYHVEETAEIDDIKSGWLEPDETMLAAQMGIYCYLSLLFWPWILRVKATAWLLRSGGSLTMSMGRHDLEREGRSISAAIAECERPLLLLAPSAEACKHCRAAPTCPGARSISHELATVDAAGLPAPQLNRLYGLALLAEKGAKDVRAAMRAAIEAGTPGLDYELKETAGNREVKDMPALWGHLSWTLGESSTLALLDLSVPDAEKAFKAAVVAEGSKDGAARWRKIEAECIGRGEPRKTIVRKTKEES